MLPATSMTREDFRKCCWCSRREVGAAGARRRRYRCRLAFRSGGGPSYYLLCCAMSSVGNLDRASGWSAPSKLASAVAKPASPWRARQGGAVGGRRDLCADVTPAEAARYVPTQRYGVSRASRPAPGTSKVPPTHLLRRRSRSITPEGGLFGVYAGRSLPPSVWPKNATRRQNAAAIAKRSSGFGWRRK